MYVGHAHSQSRLLDRHASTEPKNVRVLHALNSENITNKLGKGRQMWYDMVNDSHSVHHAHVVLCVKTMAIFARHMYAATQDTLHHTGARPSARNYCSVNTSIKPTVITPSHFLQHGALCRHWPIHWLDKTRHIRREVNFTTR